MPIYSSLLTAAIIVALSPAQSITLLLAAIILLFVLFHFFNLSARVKTVEADVKTVDAKLETFATANIKKAEADVKAVEADLVKDAVAVASDVKKAL